DRDDDVVAIACQRFVDGVVHDLEDHVVQARAVGSVADVHAGPLAYGFQALEHLDRIGAVAGGRGGLGGGIWHENPGVESVGGSVGPEGVQMRIGMTTYLNSSSPGSVISTEALASGCTDQRTVSVLMLVSTSSR